MPLWAKYVPLLNEELMMIIRAKAFKVWLFANFDQQALKDLAEHGANGGWSGITYYRDTCKLYRKFKEEIWEMLFDDAESLGYSNVFELMSSFRGVRDVGSCYQFENLMVWYAAEKLAYRAVDEEE